MPLRGRIAPTPTGLLHVGHARTFALAAERAAGAGLVMRIEDLDCDRCRPEFTAAALDDLRWLGLEWTEGPDIGGPHAPYEQSRRGGWFLDIWRRLEAVGVIYPSPHSRRDVEEAASAPHSTQPDSAATQTEPIFPVALRPTTWGRASSPGGVAWRFRVPDGRVIEFHDGRLGRVTRTAGSDFGDFVVWRRDDLAAYELAVVADDHAMEIEEVVRGEDLLTSTARQLLLYEALGWQPPRWFHAPLVVDAEGRRLAKRTGGLAIRDLRARGLSPADVLHWPSM
jgi:glutamyl-tRNA synthetase